MNKIEIQYKCDVYKNIIVYILIVFMIIFYRYNDKIIEYTKFVYVKEQGI